MIVRSRIPNIERIKELQHPFTQQEFCEKCGISRQTLQRAYSGHRVEFETLQAIAAAFPNEIREAEELGLPEPASDRLCDRITRRGLWPDLADACRNIVIIGGTAGMRTYSEESARIVATGRGSAVLGTISIPTPSQPEKNPTFPADVEAVLPCIQTADLHIKAHADKLRCAVSYLAEELIKYGDSLRIYLGEVGNRAHSPQEFFDACPNVLRTLADPLDGSVNHGRGIPIFCSAVALLVDDQPRVCAIFDPVHNIVYAAALMGEYDKPERQAVASAWEISTGHTVDLVELARRQKRLVATTSGAAAGAAKTGFLRSQGIAVHMPRKDAAKRQEMIGRLDVIAENFDSVYMLNAGIPAMTLVAKASLAAFANPWTNLHDIAAGEVLCRATDCQVTDWDGRPIKYGGLLKDPNGDFITKTSVLAARKEVHPEILNLIRPNKAAAAAPGGAPAASKP